MTRMGRQCLRRRNQWIVGLHFAQFCYISRRKGNPATWWAIRKADGIYGLTADPRDATLWNLKRDAIAVAEYLYRDEELNDPQQRVVAVARTAIRDYVTRIEARDALAMLARLGGRDA